VEKLLDAARKLCASYGWQTAKLIEEHVRFQAFASITLPKQVLF